MGTKSVPSRAGCREKGKAGPADDYRFHDVVLENTGQGKDDSFIN
jgi:hypothetical protein